MREPAYFFGSNGWIVRQRRRHVEMPHVSFRNGRFRYERTILQLNDRPDRKYPHAEESVGIPVCLGSGSFSEYSGNVNVLSPTHEHLVRTLGVGNPVGRNTSTLQDVAKLAGVSTATVSRVLNANHQTSACLRIAVMRAMSTLHYVPNLHAMELARANNGKKRKRVKVGIHGANTLPSSSIEAAAIQKADLSALTSRMLSLEKENAFLRRALSELISEVDHSKNKPPAQG